MLEDQAEQLTGKKTKSVTYANNWNGAGSLADLLHWWNTLTKLGPLGYHPETIKCWLIVKPNMKDLVFKTLENISNNITEDRKCHLASTEYRENYITQKVNTWLDELSM